MITQECVRSNAQEGQCSSKNASVAALERHENCRLLYSWLSKAGSCTFTNHTTNLRISLNMTGRWGSKPASLPVELEIHSEIHFYITFLFCELKGQALARQFKIKMWHPGWRSFFLLRCRKLLTQLQSSQLVSLFCFCCSQFYTICSARFFLFTRLSTATTVGCYVQVWSVFAP